jgi:hypothetical protein
VNQGGKRGNRKTVVANSMLTSSTAAAPKASKAGSFGATAQPVGSLALSGDQLKFQTLLLQRQLA